MPPSPSGRPTSAPQSRTPARPNVPHAPLDRQALLNAIAPLWNETKRLGIDLGSLKKTAEALQVRANGTMDDIPLDVLRDMEVELRAALDSLQKKENARKTRERHASVNLQRMALAASLAALLGGAVIQRAFDPIGKISDVISGQDDEDEVSKAPAPSPKPNPAVRPAAPKPALPPKLQPAPQPKPTPPAKSKPRPPRESDDIGVHALAHLNDGNFNRITRRGLWVVDFYADWCGPCKLLAPVFVGAFRSNETLGTGVRFAKFKVSDSQWDDFAETARRNGRGVPFILFMKGGAVVGRLDGAGDDNGLWTAADFQRKIDAMLPPSDGILPRDADGALPWEETE